MNISELRPGRSSTFQVNRSTFHLKYSPFKGWRSTLYRKYEVSIKNGHVLRDTLRLRYLKKDVEPMKEKQTRKRLDAQTKEYILKSVLEDGAKVSDLAFKFEIGSSTIHKWIKDYRESKNQDVTRYFTSSEVDKLQAAFDKKLRDLEEENEILKKAMHIFAKNPE